MYVRSFPDMADKYRISNDALGASSTPAEFWCSWSRDGREIVYPAADNRTLVSVAVTIGNAFHADEPRAVFRFPLNTVWVAMHPSREKFLATTPSLAGTPPAHTVVMNWWRLVDRN